MNRIKKSLCSFVLGLCNGSVYCTGGEEARRRRKKWGRKERENSLTKWIMASQATGKKFLMTIFLKNYRTVRSNNSFKIKKEGEIVEKNKKNPHYFCTLECQRILFSSEKLKGPKLIFFIKESQQYWLIHHCRKIPVSKSLVEVS